MNYSRAVAAVLALALVSMAALPVRAQSPQSDPTEAGKAVFKRANCFGCHKWHGNGGGGYGGDALSLRKTDLTRDQIIETVACGRPGTGMPYFARGAYDTTKCYEMTRQDVADRIPPEGGTFLRAPDIEAVADYVIANIKGKGEPTYAECVSFFGNTSRVCDVYKAGSESSAKSAATTGPAK